MYVLQCLTVTRECNSTIERPREHVEKRIPHDVPGERVDSNFSDPVKPPTSRIGSAGVPRYRPGRREYASQNYIILYIIRDAFRRRENRWHVLTVVVRSFDGLDIYDNNLTTSTRSTESEYHLTKSFRALNTSVMC